MARFTAPDVVTVDGRALKGRHILIARRKASSPGLSRSRARNYERCIHEELEQLPEHIAMVGGGYIAAEFSHIAARAGANVTVLQRGERMLPKFDADLVGWLMEKFREIGIEVHTTKCRDGY